LTFSHNSPSIVITRPCTHTSGLHDRSRRAVKTSLHRSAPQNPLVALWILSAVVYPCFSSIMLPSSLTQFCLRTVLMVLLLPFATPSKAQQCDCGFQDPQDPTGQIWTTYWESDFTKMSSKDLTTSFSSMAYTLQHSAAVRDFEPSNVVIDQAGLHLTVQPVNPNSNVGCAGVLTKRSVSLCKLVLHRQFMIFISRDFGFGAYHFEAQTTNIAGTVQVVLPLCEPSWRELKTRFNSDT
jgi:hypothetical protein